MDRKGAQALWLDEGLRELNVACEGEARFLMGGTIGMQHRTAIVTYRGADVRLISVRRSRAEEVDGYGR